MVFSGEYMKRFYIVFFSMFFLFGCNRVQKKSGIIIWDKSEDLSYDVIQSSDFIEMLNQYPNSLFIDFKDVDKYSKDNQTFFIDDKKWVKRHEEKFGFYLQSSDVYYFSIILNNENLLTGISRTSNIFLMSPKKIQYPYDNPIFLNKVEDGFQLSFTDGLVSRDKHESDLQSKIELLKLEKYFAKK